ncbi:MAG: Asp-tRNA(Asn)/Glu-tRNA(Gln) amidotransferase subunit GatB [Candidatus Shapirobacteria bacterium]
MKVTPIIGLEVHVELRTKSKMFCGCPAEHFHVEPNTHTCPVCLGYPGALPVPNKTALDWCAKIGLALNCSINPESFFERKNYFYPDLPKGYQITQLQKPLAINGFLEIDSHKIRINRAHMEEDTGKSVHTTLNGQEVTLLDYNRSGVPLVEIVSEPDIVSAQEAKTYLTSLQQIIRYLEVSDADIEKGSMRCEPTINLKIEAEQGVFYTPLVEVKNVASLTGVMVAIDFEINRQLTEWQTTGIVKSDANKTTRGWDADRQVTFLQREKEGSADYRYFPEPDIPPFAYTSSEVELIKSTIPELPQQVVQRYVEMGLPVADAQTLSKSKDFSAGYEKYLTNLSETKDKKTVANLYLGALSEYLNLENADINLSQVNPQHSQAIIQALASNQISSTSAKFLFVESYKSGQDPLEIAKNQNLFQVSDINQIEEIIRKVIDTNPKAVSDFHKNPSAIGFLLGQVMKASGGSANPVVAKSLLEKYLSP